MPCNGDGDENGNARTIRQTRWTAKVEQRLKTLECVDTWYGHSKSMQIDWRKDIGVLRAPAIQASC